MTIRLHAILPFVVLALATAGCAKRDPEANRRRSQALVLRRQIEGLRDLIAAAERGELSGAEHILIAVEEKLLGDLLNSNLPPETVVAERFRVRLTGAEVRFRASQSLVLLRARISLVKDPDRFGDVLLGGGLEEVQIEPGTGRLTARVSLFHFELEKSSGGALAPIVQALLDEFGREGLQALAETIPAIEIPVRLEPQIRIAGFGDGPVSATPGRLPIRISIARVVPLSGRLWILLDASAGPWESLADAPPPPEAAKAASASSPEEAARP